MNLTNRLPLAAEEPGEADAVRSGPLHTERHELPVRADMGEAEREQLLVPGDGRGDEQLGEPAAESVEQNGDVFVFVSVDADDDIVVS